MDDAGAVQRRHRARQLGRDADAFGQRQLRRTVEPLLQRLALVERHHRIEPGLPLRGQFDDLADPQAAHPRRDPGLADEGEAIGAFAGDARMRKLQHDFAAVRPVGRLEQAAVAAVRQDVAEHEIVDRRRRFPANPESASVAIEWVSSSRSAGGRSTTSSTSAVMLSLLPAASAASTSARANSSGEVRSLQQLLQAVIGRARHGRRRCRSGAGHAAAARRWHNRSGRTPRSRWRG